MDFITIENQSKIDAMSRAFSNEVFIVSCLDTTTALSSVSAYIKTDSFYVAQMLQCHHKLQEHLHL
jgi:hypothetical protein